MNLGEKIRLARTIKGYSQEYMAEKLMLTQKTFSQIENNRKKIKFDKLKEIVVVLDLDFERLLSLDESNILNNTFQNNSKNIQNFFCNNNPSDFEREFYEKQIKFLQDELALLREERIAFIKLLEK